MHHKNGRNSNFRALNTEGEGQLHVVAMYRYKITSELPKVPYEGLNKTFRGSQKVIDRELSYVLGAASEATARSKDANATSDDVMNTLDSVILKLTSLKRKVISPHELF